ncbi:MAG: bifunctional diaminohydroxyphosphoribosylaminopyrimidine deaminase/5-amino-6-(5-phosphoribosylamino)uracil reductase RibD [Vicinamibacterales bacterium]
MTPRTEPPVDKDWRFMERVLFLAGRGRGRTAPNPMVGAVVVSEGGVVEGAGYHERAGLAHAEVVALDAAGSRAKGATLYCNLEPCCHTGRTGPCVVRIVEAGIRRVVASMEDPNPLVRGQGFAYLRARGVEVEVGLGRREAIALNRPFITATNEGRPFVILKTAVSLDGRIASAAATRTPITSEAALRHAHGVRAEVDAIAIGSGTLVSDDPALTPRHACRARPLVRVVFDRSLRTTSSARLLSTLSAGPILILTSPTAVGSPSALELEAAGARVLDSGGSFLEAIRLLTSSFEVQSLLVEGGALLHAAAWDAGCVDHVQAYVGATFLGSGGVPVFGGRPVPLAALNDPKVTPLGPDVLIEGSVKPTD